MNTYADVETRTIAAANGVVSAYRSLGHGDDRRSLVLLQYFRGKFDNWVPALVDALARERRVITFDNRGAGATSGSTPHPVGAMAEDAVEFVTALGLTRIDLLRFSLDSFVAREIALLRPELVNSCWPRPHPRARRACTAGRARSSRPSAARAPPRRDTQRSSFTCAKAGQAVAGRVFGARTEGRDAPTTWATRLAQYDAVTRWGIPNHAHLERLQATTQPVFVANGDSDPMILPRQSHLPAGLLPNAVIKIYPDAAHGFLFQHFEDFAADVAAFPLGPEPVAAGRVFDPCPQPAQRKSLKWPVSIRFPRSTFREPPATHSRPAARTAARGRCATCRREPARP